MSLIKIIDKDIYINSQTIDVDSLFTDCVIKKSNKLADTYAGELCTINELYQNYVLPSIGLELFFLENNVTEVDVRKANVCLLPIVQCIANKHNISLINVPCLTKIKFLEKVFQCGAFIYLLLQQLKQSYHPLILGGTSVVFIRSKATRKKFSKLKEIDRLNEIKPGIGSIYRQVCLIDRIILLYKSLKLSKTIKTEMEVYLKEHALKECIPYVMLYYSKRLIHTAFYYLIQDYILSRSSWKTLYTGNNLDRFAINEELLSLKYNMKLICIPHGIEYGFKFPKEFIGDVFYTCTSNASIYLNYLYNTNKYVFSEEVGNLMFKLDAPLPDMPRVVYFTEPREYYVNVDIVKTLNEFMRHSNIQLYVKLHPADKRNNYKELFSMGIKEIVDFQEALVGNICISRKSTTLLEAVYNKGVAVAIITNEKDKAIYNSFPSLKDDSILCFYSADEAANYIVNMHCDLQAKRYIQ